MALCGAGCTGFVNVACGLRAIGYIEPDPLPAGPVAMMTHSGSVFSALLRARRGFGFSVAVSSRQELVTSAAPHRRRATSEWRRATLRSSDSWRLFREYRGKVAPDTGEAAPCGAVALPPVGRSAALRMIGRLRAADLLAGARGAPPADLAAVADAITALSVLAGELGGLLAAFDINPLICGPSGAVAVDALAVPRLPRD
jgi:ATP-grasp domain